MFAGTPLLNNKLPVTKTMDNSPDEDDNFYVVMFDHDPEEVALLRDGISLCSSVQLKKDERNFNDLSAIFIEVSVEVLQRVWESNNKSFDVCFDLLKAWQASHGPVLLSLHQLEFDFDADDWPSLPRLVGSSLSPGVPHLQAQFQQLTVGRSNDSCIDDRSLSGMSEEWSFCEDTSVDAKDILSDIEDNWIEVNMNGDHDSNSQLKDNAFSRPSFRDILLSSITSSQSSNKRCRSENDTHSSKKKTLWRPKIVCVHVPRRHSDVMYMDSAAMKDAHAWDYIDDDDEIGYSNGYGSDSLTSKCFAQSALSNAWRIRNVVRQSNNQNLKVRRCKY